MAELLLFSASKIKRFNLTKIGKKSQLTLYFGNPLNMIDAIISGNFRLLVCTQQFSI